jgi:hypothetical protein
MISEIGTILLLFRDSFSRSVSFNWFVIVITGFIVRLDQHGVSSIVRWLSLDSSYYHALLAFFKTSSWKLCAIQQRWQDIVVSFRPPILIDERSVIVGDGIKISKEASYMPGVKKLHQESDNSGKAPYIQGHHFGVLGILAGHMCKKIFCIPLRAEIHEGVEDLRAMQNKPVPKVNGRDKLSVTTLMASMAVDLITGMNTKALLVLDAYFAVGPVFLILKAATDSTGKRIAHLVTRAKSNVVAFKHPPPKTGRRGAPRKYGDKIKLNDLFTDKRSLFERATIDVYQSSKTIRFLVLDLLWKPVKEKIRFVLVIDGDEHFILMCSDLSLSAENIIRAYGYRFKIEVTFKVLKHLIGAFSYHFWTSVWPKIGNRAQSDLSGCFDAYSRMLITQTANAIEGFVNFGCIATGILQLLSIKFHDTIWSRYHGWLRTVSSSIPSEETVRLVVCQEYYHNFRRFKNTAIYRIIMSKFKKSFNIKMPAAA